MREGVREEGRSGGGSDALYCTRHACKVHQSLAQICASPPPPFSVSHTTKNTRRCTRAHFLFPSIRRLAETLFQYSPSFSPAPFSPGGDEGEGAVRGGLARGAIRRAWRLASRKSRKSREKIGAEKGGAAAATAAAEDGDGDGEKVGGVTARAAVPLAATA